jgi:sec-independent protein translocase protein TatA
MFPQLGIPEMMIIMGIAVLLFGKRLPEVGRSLGKGIIEFKKGLRGMEDGFTESGLSAYSAPRHSDASGHARSESSEPVVPKFELPPTSTVPQMEYEPQAPRD